MFNFKTSNGEYGLAPTAEECATIFGANRLLSHKNMPATYYQIGEKFRNEKRARGYLFRPRTFVMMDAYSFDKTEEDMVKTYNLMHETYLNIFKRLGIKIIPTVSDSGVIGGNVAEEFQAVTEIGEDIVLYDEKTNIGLNKEVLDFENKEEYLKQIGNPDLSKMKEYNAVELGNNFQLGTKYSESMKLYFKDEDGKQKPYYMGCYGIGLGRIIACLIENNIIKENGKIKGFSLPKEIAPYKLQIVYMDNKKEIAEDLYKKLKTSTIIDDREGYSLGNKIKDAYVLGTPYIAIIGNNFDGKTLEIEETKTGNKINIDIDKLEEFLQKNDN